MYDWQGVLHSLWKQLYNDDSCASGGAVFLAKRVDLDVNLNKLFNNSDLPDWSGFGRGCWSPAPTVHVWKFPWYWTPEMPQMWSWLQSECVLDKRAHVWIKELYECMWEWVNGTCSGESFECSNWVQSTIWLKTCSHNVHRRVTCAKMRGKKWKRGVQVTIPRFLFSINSQELCAASFDARFSNKQQVTNLLTLVTFGKSKSSRDCISPTPGWYFEGNQ